MEEKFLGPKSIT